MNTQNNLEAFADIFRQNDERIAKLIQLALKPEIKRDALYSYNEVATLAGVSLITIKRAAQSERLKADYIGSEPRIRGAAILQFG